MHGTVRASDSGEPLAYATVEIVEMGLTAVTDADGGYAFGRRPDGRFEVRASAFGYRSQTRRLTPGQVTLDFALEPEPIHLRPLTARVARRQEGGAAERALYDREIAPALVGVSGREIRDVPILVEPDVLRSLQAVPAVARLNDLSAQLHVHGGAAGQNTFLWDGVRVFAPYHMFGMIGAFNPDAVGRVDFYRGHFPARYGGVLSSVIDVQPPAETADTLMFRGGLTLLGGRLVGRGQARDGGVQWLAAGRVTHTGLLMDRLFQGGVPYDFHDLQGRVRFALSDRDQVTASGLSSRDHFEMLFNEPAGATFSRWRNGATKLEWTGERGTRAYTASAWTTRYAGAIRVGGGANSPEASNRVSVTGVSGSLSRPGRRFGIRIGMDLQTGTLGLEGAERVGGYVHGSQHDEWFSGAAYTELEIRTGPLRTAPGVRVTHTTAGDRTLVEPRLSSRLSFSDDVALTVGIARTHQYLSVLQDDRYVMPGSPFWFVHSEGAPVSRADNLGASLDVWHGRQWSVNLGGFARRFIDVPAWRPSGARTLDQIRYEDGNARGGSVMVRRHQGRLTGWAGYSVSKTRLRHSTLEGWYAPPWDRTHSADMALFFHLNDRVTISGRAVYGSGQPFWPRVGEIDSQRFSPLEGTIRLGEGYPVWGDQQLRMADYFRLDGSVRGRFNLGRFDLEVFASMLNLRERPNVLYYRLGDVHDRDGDERVALIPEHVVPFFPSIGFNLWF